MTLFNHVPGKCSGIKSLAREDIFEVFLLNTMQQNNFYYVLQSNDGIRNAI